MEVDTNVGLTIIFGSFLVFAFIVGAWALLSGRRHAHRKP